MTIVAVAVRLVFLIQSTSGPTFDAPIVDARNCHDLAFWAANGGKIVPKFFWQQCFYPFWLTAVYVVGGKSIVFAKLVQVLLGGITCGLTWMLGRKIFGPRVGIAASLITVVCGPLIFFEQELLAAGWASTWAVLLVLLFIEAEERTHRFVLPVLGVVGGLGVLTRPNFLLFFVCACVWLLAKFLRSGSTPARAVLSLGAVLAGFLVAVTPASLKNQETTGHFSFIAATGGLNFYKGNNPDARRTVAIRPGADWDRLMTLPRARGIRDPREESAFYYREAFAYMKEQPLHAAVGLGRKTLQLVNGREMPGNVDIYVYRQWSSLLALLTWKFGWFGFPMGLLLPLAAVCLVFERRRVPPVIWILLVTYGLSVAAFVVYARYRVPLAPIVAVLAAQGASILVAGLRGLRNPRVWSSWGPPTAVFAAGLLSCSLPGPFLQEKLDLEPELHVAVGTFWSGYGTLDQAIPHYARAIELDPNFYLAHSNMGATLIMQGRLDDAAKHLERAVELNPRHADAWFNLGSVRQQHGDVRRADECYRKAAEINPDHYNARINLGYLYLQLRRFREAERFFREAKQIAPLLPQADAGLAAVRQARAQNWRNQ